jgi:hypothetical protein
MQAKTNLSKDERQERKQVYQDIRDAFADKYSFLGARSARELLMSAASWNIDKYSNPPFRYRNHVMLTWEPGWVKSTLLRKMQMVLGDDLVSTCGKLTAAVLRGSVSGGKFSPPAPLKAPIVASTEFGQTEFNDELLNTYLALLEEGKTNVSLNKIAGLSEGAKRNAQKRFDGITFKENNEFDLEVDFVFWGATHDPTLLAENALKSRFNIVAPAEPLTGEVTELMDKSPPITKTLDNTTIQDVRTIVKSEKEVATNFKPPSQIYRKFSLSPRESRDVQSYMAARNWWGLEVNPDIMIEFIKEHKRSRRVAAMSTKERVKNLIFDNPLTYEEIMTKTGLTKFEIHGILQDIDAQRAGVSHDDLKWVVRSGDKTEEETKQQYFADLGE